MPLCQVPHCKRSIGKKIHRLCHAHYARWRRTGSVGTDPIQERPRTIPYQFAHDPAAQQVHISLEEGDSHDALSQD